MSWLCPVPKNAAVMNSSFGGNQENPTTFLETPTFVIGEDFRERRITQALQERGSLSYFEKDRASRMFTDPSSPPPTAGDLLAELAQNFPSSPLNLTNVLSGNLLVNKIDTRENECRFARIPIPGLGMVEGFRIFLRGSGVCAAEESIDHYEGYANPDATPSNTWVPKASFTLYLEGDAPLPQDCNLPLVRRALSHLFVNGVKIAESLQQQGEIPERLFIDSRTNEYGGMSLFGDDTLYLSRRGNFIYVESPGASWGLQCSSFCGFDTETQFVKPSLFMEIVPASSWDEASKKQREYQAWAETKKREVGKGGWYTNRVTMTCEEAENPQYAGRLLSERLKRSLSESCKLIPKLCTKGLDKAIENNQFALTGREARGIHTFGDILSPKVLSKGAAKCSFTDSTFSILGVQQGFGQSLLVGDSDENARPAVCRSEEPAKQALHYENAIIPRIQFQIYGMESRSLYPEYQCSERFVKSVLAKLLNTKTYGDDIATLRQVAGPTMGYRDYPPGDNANRANLPADLQTYASSWRENIWYRYVQEKSIKFANDFWGVNCTEGYSGWNSSYGVSIRVHPLMDLARVVDSEERMKKSVAQKQRGKRVITFDYRDALQADKRRDILNKEAMRKAELQSEQAMLRECREKGIPPANCKETLKRLLMSEWEQKERAEALCDSMYYQCRSGCAGFPDFSEASIKCGVDCMVASERCKKAIP